MTPSERARTELHTMIGMVTIVTLTILISVFYHHLTTPLPPPLEPHSALYTRHNYSASCGYGILHTGYYQPDPLVCSWQNFEAKCGFVPDGWKCDGTCWDECHVKIQVLDTIWATEPAAIVKAKLKTAGVVSHELPHYEEFKPWWKNEREID